MKFRFRYLFIAIFVCFLVYVGYGKVTATEYIGKNRDVLKAPAAWNSTIATSINSKPISMYIDGLEVSLKNGKIYMDNSMTIMMPADIMTEAFDCSINLYDDTKLIIERGSISVTLTMYSDVIEVDGLSKKLTTAPIKSGNVAYVPLSCIVDNFGYTYSWDVKENKAVLINDNPQERSIPYKYSYVETGRIPAIKNQGYFGTCWATASLSAIESTLRPEEAINLSVDHMSISNSFGLSQYDGGDYSMAIAYLSSWQGPVLEEEDPYGDGISDNTLLPIKHIQEVQIIPSKDFEAIKKMVYKYGGVSTSIYTSLNDSYGYSKYYNKQTNSYCYIGEAKPNHEVVIVGWDDNYPKENFNSELEGNGAFLCQNSWGTNFGDDGLFYISYYDTNIGIHNVVYTGVEPTNNYDAIYQSDLCGWRGNLGYEKESAYFANVYTAQNNETLQAISFYAVDVDTYYEIAVCTNFGSVYDLGKSTSVLANGTVKNSGYYTIDLDKGIDLKKGEKFAIVMYIQTPNATRPVAVEIAADYKTAKVDISDGEGYISYTGREWKRVEEEYGCNLCLKGFTKLK